MKKTDKSNSQVHLGYLRLIARSMSKRSILILKALSSAIICLAFGPGGVTIIFGPELFKIIRDHPI
jgi:hypothetical protein